MVKNTRNRSNLGECAICADGKKIKLFPNAQGLPMCRAHHYRTDTSIGVKQKHRSHEVPLECDESSVAEENLTSGSSSSSSDLSNDPGTAAVGTSSFGTAEIGTSSVPGSLLKSDNDEVTSKPNACGSSIAQQKEPDPRDKLLTRLRSCTTQGSFDQRDFVQDAIIFGISPMERADFFSSSNQEFEYCECQLWKRSGDASGEPDPHIYVVWAQCFEKITHRDMDVMMRLKLFKANRRHAEIEPKTSFTSKETHIETILRQTDEKQTDERSLVWPNFILGPIPNEEELRFQERYDGYGPSITLVGLDSQALEDRLKSCRLYFDDATCEYVVDYGNSHERLTEAHIRQLQNEKKLFFWRDRGPYRIKTIPELYVNPHVEYSATQFLDVCGDIYCAKDVTHIRYMHGVPVKSSFIYEILILQPYWRLKFLDPEYMEMDDYEEFFQGYFTRVQVYYEDFDASESEYTDRFKGESIRLLMYSMFSKERLTASMLASFLRVGIAKITENANPITEYFVEGTVCNDSFQLWSMEIDKLLQELNEIEERRRRNRTLASAESGDTRAADLNGSGSSESADSLSKAADTNGVVHADSVASSDSVNSKTADTTGSAAAQSVDRVGAALNDPASSDSKTVDADDEVEPVQKPWSSLQLQSGHPSLSNSALAILYEGQGVHPKKRSEEDAVEIIPFLCCAPEDDDRRKAAEPYVIYWTTLNECERCSKSVLDAMLAAKLLIPATHDKEAPSDHGIAKMIRALYTKRGPHSFTLSVAGSAVKLEAGYYKGNHVVENQTNRKNSRCFAFFRDKLRLLIFYEQVGAVVVPQYWSNNKATNQEQVYLSLCVMVNTRDSTKPVQILVMLTYTRCKDKRLDLWILDSRSNVIHRHQNGHAAFSEYRCDPSIPFDSPIVKSAFGGRALNCDALLKSFYDKAEAEGLIWKCQPSTTLATKFPFLHTVTSFTGRPEDHPDTLIWTLHFGHPDDEKEENSSRVKRVSKRVQSFAEEQTEVQVEPKRNVREKKQKLVPAAVASVSNNKSYAVGASIEKLVTTAVSKAIQPIVQSSILTEKCTKTSTSASMINSEERKDLKLHGFYQGKAEALEAFIKSQEEERTRDKADAKESEIRRENLRRDENISIREHEYRMAKVQYRAEGKKLEYSRSANEKQLERDHELRMTELQHQGMSASLNRDARSSEMQNSMEKRLPIAENRENRPKGYYNNPFAILSPTPELWRLPSEHESEFRSLYRDSPYESLSGMRYAPREARFLPSGSGRGYSDGPWTGENIRDERYESNGRDPRGDYYPRGEGMNRQDFTGFMSQYRYQDGPQAPRALQGRR